ncbi:MAG: contractile injection system tape measure protein [Cycloclasticus sp.]
MTLNIDTLQLDLEYLQDGVGLSSANRANIERQLRELMLEAVTGLSLQSLPQGWQSVQQGEDGSTRLHIPNLEINLPAIDGEAFLKNGGGYFNLNLLPALEQGFYRALLRAVQATGMAAGVDTAPSSQAFAGQVEAQWHNIQLALLVGSGPLAFRNSPHAKDQQASLVLPRLFECLQQSAQYRDEFKHQLLIPRVFARLFSWLGEDGHTQKLLTLLFPAIEQERWWPLLQDACFNTARKKALLKSYLDMLVCGGGQLAAARLALDISLKVQVLGIPQPLDSYPLRQTFVHLQQALVMGQSDDWLKRCESWLTIVMHQGLHASDVQGLQTLLQGAKGSTWCLDRPEADRATLTTPAGHSVMTHNLKQAIQAHRRLLRVLNPLHNFSGTESGLWWQLAKIKHVLALDGVLLAKDTVLQVQESLWTLNESQQAGHTLMPRMASRMQARAAQMMEELSQLVDEQETMGVVRRGQTVARLLAILNELALCPWQPLMLKHTLDRLGHTLVGFKRLSPSVSHAIFNDPLFSALEMQGLRQALLGWGEYLSRLFTLPERSFAKPQLKTVRHNGALNPLARAPQAASLDHSPPSPTAQLMASLQRLLSHWQEHSDVSGAESGQPLSLLCILAHGRLPLQVQEAISQFLATPCEASAHVLREGLRVDASPAPPQLMIGQDNQYQQCFHAEWHIQGQLKTIMVALLQGFTVSSAPAVAEANKKPLLSLSEYEHLFQHAMNKQQLYELMVKLLSFLQGQVFSRRSDSARLNVCVEALVALTRKLQKLEPSVGLARELWWLPLVTQDVTAVTSKGEAPIETAAQRALTEHAIGSSGEDQALTPPQIHQLIWHHDLKKSAQVLQNQPPSNPAIKRSLLLLNAAQQKVKGLLEADKLQALTHKLQTDLQSLNVQQKKLNEQMLSMDAGLLLLWPFLADFFKKNQLLANNGQAEDAWDFVDDAAQCKAHALLVYLLDGQPNDATWTVANLLTGFEPDTFFEDNVELSEQECTRADGLLQAVIRNWSALKDMPVSSFKDVFLLRQAHTSLKGDAWCVLVHAKTLDVLLSKLPWGLGYVSLPWLGKNLIQVDWNYGL